MKIEFVNIRNFRKLKDCRIDLSDTQTLLVGANNSGKTSAMDALILFLKEKNKFTTRDFTLSNWNSIKSIGNRWVEQTDNKDLDFTIESWVDHIPTLDMWISVKNDELHYVSHLIPTLDWNGGFLGIRLRFEPQKIENLYLQYVQAYKDAQDLIGSGKGKGNKFKIWPGDLWEFLDERGNLNSHFKVTTYLLDPALYNSQQRLSDRDIPLEGDPFMGLIKIDIINAQRGFSDVNSDPESSNKGKNLSSQLRSYYDKHLNPTLNPTENDIDALKAIHEAQKIFDEKLGASFKPAFSELELLNYPGFGNPQIKLSSQFHSMDGLNHESAVQYSLPGGLSLPEKYNGLGYQNLISIIFKLIRFRDEWMQVGKKLDITKKDSSNSEFEPLHLVLIEEPEAHLHAQVQQVFIRKAYEVLRNHPYLKGNRFFTQLVLSTHSSHIAHEVDFSSLRYFKRQILHNNSTITSTVVNLSKTFGDILDTTKFAKRYLKTTHCDLFFADAVIMVEGPAERMLVPAFVKNHTKLDNCYISILEIGGSHAHTLQRLVENLGIVCLIITDIDSVDPSKNRSKVMPEIGKGYETGNDTLIDWVPQKKVLDLLLNLSELEKRSNNYPIKVAYQIPVTVKVKEKQAVVYPYTFEDSLVLENIELFSKFENGKGLLKKMVTAAQGADLQNIAREMYDAITEKGTKKAEFALALLYLEDPLSLTPPKYIAQGLEWLEEKLTPPKTELDKKA